MGELLLLPFADMAALLITGMIWMHRMTQRYLALRERELGHDRKAELPRRS